MWPRRKVPAAAAAAAPSPSPSPSLPPPPPPPRPRARVLARTTPSPVRVVSVGGGAGSWLRRAPSPSGADTSHHPPAEASADKPALGKPAGKVTSVGKTTPRSGWKPASQPGPRATIAQANAVVQAPRGAMKRPRAAETGVGSKRAAGTDKRKRRVALPRAPMALSWTQSVPKPASRSDGAGSADAAAPTPSPVVESFDEVFADVFHGGSAPADDGEDGYVSRAHSLGDAAAARASSSTRPVRSMAAPSTQEDADEDGAWGFTTPSAIELDAFDDAPTALAHSVDSDTTRAMDTPAFARWKAEGGQHAVSSNFVRQHTERTRVRGSSGRAKKKPAYLRARGPTAVEREQQLIATAGDASTLPVAGQVPPLSAEMDFLDECLDVLAQEEAALAQRNALTSAAKKLDEAASNSEPKEELEAEPAPVTSTGEEKADEATATEPPRCFHALPAQSLVVKKKSKNHGRRFFCCALGWDEGRCDFFLWEDDHAPIAMQQLLRSSSADGAHRGEDQEDEDEASALARAEVEALRRRLAPMDLLQQEGGAVVATTAWRTNLRLVFGHANFRDGQEWAITRVFERRRTLLVLPTGAGKSLCYQFPALFLPGLTLVVSPLISLMNDQFQNLPPLLQRQAACLSSTSSKAAYANLVRDLMRGGMKLLFVSPERALSRGFQRLLARLPTRVSLICVDEAHCISEWSHHFRPSYLRLQRALFGRADAVLAITATASRAVEQDILQQLVRGESDRTSGTKTAQEDKKHEHEQSAEDDTEQAVLRMPWQRQNLALRIERVASDEDRLDQLCAFLAGDKKGRAAATGAVIMYVHQQWQTEALAALLQERLAVANPAKWGGSSHQTNGNSKGKSNSKPKSGAGKIAFYHAKMDAEAKERVRRAFLRGRVSLVIATIAFGMGIDKGNVRGVIHFHVPSSIEHYLQQVGRAGRDGKHAEARLFLLDHDVRTFRSLLYSNALHPSQLRHLVRLLVTAAIGSTNHVDNDTGVVVVQVSPTMRRVWLDVAWLEYAVDMKAATIETFLTLLSLLPNRKGEIKDDVGEVDDPIAISLRGSGAAPAWSVLHLTERQMQAANARSKAELDGSDGHGDDHRLLAKLVAIVMADDSRDGGYVKVDTDGYARKLRVRFHVGALAHALFPTATASGGIAVDESAARRLQQRAHAWQRYGLVNRVTMETPAFALDVERVGGNGSRYKAGEGGEGQEIDCQEQQERLIARWTALLLKKHRALETMELSRLTSLYGALSAAADATERENKKRGQDNSDSEDEGEDEEEGDTTLAASQVLERKLVAYFEQDGRDTDIGARTEKGEDAERMGALMAPLTPPLVIEIEHDIRELIVSPPPPPSEQQDDASAVQQRVMWHAYALARVCHGLGSPCFPGRLWRHSPFWKKYTHVAFEQIVPIAERALHDSGAQDQN